MKRHSPSPYSRPRPRLRLSHLAAAVAATLVAASPAAGDEVRAVAAMQVRLLPDGRQSTTLAMRAAGAGAAPRADGGMAQPTLRVTSCADDGGPGTLRSVVESAAEGGTVDLRRLACRRIELSGSPVMIPPTVGRLTIVGRGAQAMTLDGAGLSNVLVHAGAGTLVVHGLSIENGRAVDEWGGCISAPSGHLRLSHVRVRSCVAHQVTGQRGAIMGGAIFAFGNVSVEDSEILDGTASSELPGSTVPPGGGGGEGVVIYPVVGGGIATLLGDITLTRSRVTGNHLVATPGGGLGRVRGGGLYTQAGAVTLIDSVIDRNAIVSDFEDVDGYTSFVAGGGVFALGGTLSVAGSTIAGNEVLARPDIFWQRGGGIAFMGSAAKIRDSTIEGNFTTGDGAGLHSQGSSLKLVNSTVSGNVAERGVGGLYDVTATVLDQVTVAFNRGGPVGGAQLLRGADMRNSIVSGNVADSGGPGDLATRNGRAVAGARNVIGERGCPVPPDTLAVDPMLLPLADNGGPVRTHALDPASPAVDAGEPASGLRFDQRGPGFKRKSGPASDIGAFELQQPHTDDLFTEGFEGDVSPAL